jgi:futalosine hydrolase
MHPERFDFSHVCVVAATAPEVQPLTERLRPFTFEANPSLHSQTDYHLPDGRRITVVCTGIGMVNTALYMGWYLARTTPTFLLNAGIAGSYRESIKPGDVCQVRSEIYGELGAESPSGLLTLDRLGFPTTVRPSDGLTLYNTYPNPHPPLTGLAEAVGLTTQTTAGIADTIEWRRRFWNPDIETMEGAAFFQAATVAGIPFAEIRSVSNPILPRHDTSHWRIAEAIGALNDTLLQLLLP